MSEIERALPPNIINQLRQSGYDFGAKLGVGGFGSVYSCRLTDKNNQIENLAVKHMNLAQLKFMPVFRIQGGSPEDVVRTELSAMKRANHPNVVRIKNNMSFDIFNTTHILLFMELANTDLLNRQKTVDKFGEEEAREYSAQIARGMAHLFAKRIAHLDLKPENILVFLTGETVLLKITDFGTSKLFVGSRTTQISNALMGSPRYRDPIIDAVSESSATVAYDAFKADVWSFGVIVWQFSVGLTQANHVFDTQIKNSDKNTDQIRNVYLSNKSIDEWQHFTPFLQNIFTAQTDRVSINDCCDHQWIRHTMHQQRQRLPSFDGPQPQPHPTLSPP